MAILPVTSELRNAPLFRIRIEPTDGSGLRQTSDVMVDKPQSISRAPIGRVIGRLDDASMVSVHRALAVFLGIA